MGWMVWFQFFFLLCKVWFGFGAVPKPLTALVASLPPRIPTEMFRMWPRQTSPHPNAPESLAKGGGSRGLGGVVVVGAA
jgi:hypothetical protein